VIFKVFRFSLHVWWPILCASQLETYTMQITVAGPFSETEARETARALGETNHSVYSRSRVDAEGYETDERDWFVERDTDAPTSLIFGYTWADIQRMQQNR
jgi:hypothetical protein